MRRPSTLTGLVIVFLGSIWTLQGVHVLDGGFFSGATQSVLIGLATAAAGIAVMIWANLRRR